MKKRKGILAFFTMFAMLLPVLTTIKTITASNEGYVAVINQNIRSQANDRAKPITYLTEGSKVSVVESSKNDWFKVHYDGKQGYVHRGDITSVDNYQNKDRKYHSVKTIKETNAKKEYIVAIDVNLRTRNTNQASSLKLMKQGDTVTYEGTTNNSWFLVDHQGIKGYVHRGDVTSKEAYTSSDRQLHELSVKREKGLNKLRVIIDRNLRTKDERNYGAIKTVKRNDLVTYKGTTAKDWFLVEYQGTQGYIYRGDLTAVSSGNVTPDTGETTPSDTEISVGEPNGLNYVTTSNLNLRTGNTTSHSIQMVLPKGATVKHLGTASNNWFKVEYKGTVGFVSHAYLEEEKGAEPEEEPEDEDHSADDAELSKPNGIEYFTTVNLNLRTGNNASYDRILTIPKGATVKHLGTASNNWFKVDYNGTIGFVSSRYLKEKIAQPTVKGATVFLDYGHGGPDPGAIGLGGRLEKDDALKIGLLTAEKLRSQGVIVDEARTNDPTKKLELWQRTAMANRKNYDYFVSIHRNAFNGKAHGVETFTHPNSSQKAKKLSSQIQRNLVNVGFLNRGTKEANFYVLRNTKAPAVLVEVGFIDNERDNTIFDHNLNKIANAIADGVVSEIQRNK